MKKKVEIITCYYGKLPEYFGVWLNSCANNSDFNFLIVTDNILENLPKNVKVLNLTMGELKKRFSKVLNMNVSLDSPYKLCDYKPLYGKTFKDELKEYEFWGHCDIDLIFGKLSNFITEEILDSYDIIGERGHLILYRNNDEINNLYRLEGSIFPFKTVYSHNENFGFDEMTGMNKIAIKNNIKRYTNLEIADVVRMSKRMTIECQNKCKEFFYSYKGRIFRTYEEKGILKTKEYAYLHFSEKKPCIQITEMDYSNFYIKSSGFIKRTEEIATGDELERENEFLNKKKEKREVLVYRLNKLYTVAFKFSMRQKIIWLKMQMALRKRG